MYVHTYGYVRKFSSVARRQNPYVLIWVAHALVRNASQEKITCLVYQIPIVHPWFRESVIPYRVPDLLDNPIKYYYMYVVMSTRLDSQASETGASSLTPLLRHFHWSIQPARIANAERRDYLRLKRLGQLAKGGWLWLESMYKYTV